MTTHHMTQQSVDQNRWMCKSVMGEREKEMGSQGGIEAGYASSQPPTRTQAKHGALGWPRMELTGPATGRRLARAPCARKEMQAGQKAGRRRGLKGDGHPSRPLARTVQNRCRGPRWAGEALPATRHWQIWHAPCSCGKQLTLSAAARSFSS